MAAPTVTLTSGIYVIAADGPTATGELDLHATADLVRRFRLPHWCEYVFLTGRDSGDAADARLELFQEGSVVPSLADGAAQSAHAVAIPAGVNAGYPTPPIGFDRTTARRRVGALITLSAPADAAAKVKIEMRANAPGA